MFYVDIIYINEFKLLLKGKIGYKFKNSLESSSSSRILRVPQDVFLFSVKTSFVHPTKSFTTFYTLRIRMITNWTNNISK